MKVGIKEGVRVKVTKGHNGGKEQSLKLYRSGGDRIIHYQIKGISYFWVIARSKELLDNLWVNLCKGKAINRGNRVSRRIWR